MSLYSNLLQIDISKAINEFVEYHKSNGSLSNNTLCVNVRFTASLYKEDEEDKEAYKDISLLFNGSGYVTVAFSELSSFDIEHNKDIEEINFEACHDSCWRDGTDRIVRRIAKEIDEYFKENDEVSVYNHFGLGGIKLIPNMKLRGNYEDGICKIFRND